jgi:hypothetical protein
MANAARKTSDQEMVLFQQLPQHVRRGLRISHLKAATGMILIKDRVQTYFQEVARMETALRRFKREHGYCGGRPQCLAFVGALEDGPETKQQQRPTICPRCQKEQDRIRRGDTKKITPSAYGMMRLKERKEEREEREREAHRLKARS